MSRHKHGASMLHAGGVMRCESLVMAYGLFRQRFLEP
jgi:hypothetical protein